jgi:hypothetical protein
MHYLRTILVPRFFFEDKIYSINKEVPTLFKKKIKKNHIYIYILGLVLNLNGYSLFN